MTSAWSFTFIFVTFLLNFNFIIFHESKNEYKTNE